MADIERRSDAQLPQPTRETAARNSGEYEIDLMELLYRLLASWKMIASFALAGLIIAVLYTSFFVTPMYQSTSTIYVLSRRDSAINISDLQIGTSLTNDYIRVFNMWEVHEEVISNLNLPYSYSKMRSMLSVSNASGTRMLDIKVTSPDPQEAAMIANEYANVVSNYIADTMSMDKPSIMSVALVPTNPVSPNRTKNAMLGFVLGGLLAAAIVIIGMLLDDKIRTAEDVRKYTGLANLAIIPVEDSLKGKTQDSRRSGGRD